MGFAAAGCTGPTPRAFQDDQAKATTRQDLEPPARPKLEREAQDPPRSTASLADDARHLASDEPLERLQSAQRLRQAGADGAAASLKAVAMEHGKVAAANLEFLAALDFEGLPREMLEAARQAAAAGLRREQAEIRLAAAKLLHRQGPGDRRTEFISAICDEQRKVRWQVVRRYSDNPGELESAQLLLLVSFLSDGKLAAEVRGDVHALLLAVHEALSRGARPPAYDPWAAPEVQAAALAQWDAWARAASRR
ncbi:hypothetical protein EDM80_07835 [bacterium]|nr:MAG: hypothetical protein EDM80_07835 [bacterium]RIK63599.1 MAG: hypothetical protein DCC64_07090 [Planctomycetota bacterium]